MIHGKPIEILTRFVALRVLVAVVAVASATVDTARAHGGDPTGSTDVASVSEQWAKLWSAKNLDGVVALYAEDAVFLPSTGTRVEGRDAIRELFKSALAAYDPDITVRSTKSEIVGDLAYDIGEYRETVMNKGVASTGRGSYLVVLRRSPSNRWLIVSQMWTDEPAGSH